MANIIINNHNSIRKNQNYRNTNNRKDNLFVQPYHYLILIVNIITIIIYTIVVVIIKTT